jgi:drug/metabolite transporter (DMT)-like permease
MAVIWGLPYLLIRVAVRQLDPGVLVLARTGPAALVLAPLVVWRRQWRALFAHLGWIALFGAVEFGVPWYLMSTAEKHITSSLTSLLICCVPLLSVVVQRLRGAEKVSARRLGGLGVGALGVGLLVGLDVSRGSIGWIGLMLVVVVGYSLGPIILSTKLAHVDGPTVVMGATAVVSLAWVPWDSVHWPARVSGETLECVAVLSLVCTVAAFVVFFELVKEAGPARSVVVTYLNTALAVVLGVVGLHEPFTVGIAVGFPLVLIGSILATSVAHGAPAARLEDQAA